MADAKDFETEFAALLKWAGAMPDLVADIAARPLGNRQIRGDDFPQATVWRLQQWAAVQFASMLRVLGDPLTSPTAHVLVRGLLELWAHNHFIYADGDEAEWRCRAIRLEFGMQLGIHHALEAGARTDPDEFSASLETAKERVRFIDAVKSREGCAGKKRDNGNVEATLQEIAREDQRMDWLSPLWKQSSLTSHQFGVDSVLTDLGGGRTGITDPLPSRRVGHFDHGLTAYANASQAYLALMRSDPRRLKQELDHIRGSVFFRAALDGAYGG